MFRHDVSEVSERSRPIVQLDYPQVPDIRSIHLRFDEMRLPECNVDPFA